MKVKWDSLLCSKKKAETEYPPILSYTYACSSVATHIVTFSSLNNNKKKRKKEVNARYYIPHISQRKFLYNI